MYKKKMEFGSTSTREMKANENEIEMFAKLLKWNEIPGMLIQHLYVYMNLCEFVGIFFSPFLCLCSF